ncbi:hypothetical protein ACFFRR_011770 [Megaselia abdita]
MRFIFTCVVLCCFGSSVYGGVSQIPVNFISEYVTLPLPTNNGALPVSQTSALQEGFVKGTTSYIAPLPVYEDPNQKVIQQTSYGPFHPSQELINVPVSPELPLLNRYPVNTISARQNIDNNVSVNRIQKKQVFFSEPVRSNLLYENSFQSYPSGQISQYY